ncbi:MAG: hypothetical protein KDA65_02200 [Planctomycetaceae bacterium]|nr:hypothetical protein [Planctomycetaceae bacterium]
MKKLLILPLLCGLSLFQIGCGPADNTGDPIPAGGAAAGDNAADTAEEPASSAE